MRQKIYRHCLAAADLTRRLDEPATVAATACAGGLAAVRYRHARFPREVWLWLVVFNSNR